MKWIKKVSSTPLDTTAQVIDSINVQENDSINAPSIRAVRNAITAVFADIYPVGSIYMNVGNDVNPGDIFGGVWEEINGKFLYACSEQRPLGTIGGADYFDITPSGTVGNHTLTAAEIPAHSHSYSDKFRSESDSLLEYTQGTKTMYPLTALVDNTESKYTANAGGGGAHNHGFTGSTQRYLFMPHYLSVKVWKRVG